MIGETNFTCNPSNKITINYFLKYKTLIITNQLIKITFWGMINSLSITTFVSTIFFFVVFSMVRRFRAWSWTSWFKFSTSITLVIQMMSWILFMMIMSISSIRIIFMSSWAFFITIKPISRSITAATNVSGLFMIIGVAFITTGGWTRSLFRLFLFRLFSFF